jgi:hypothetical protein
MDISGDWLSSPYNMLTVFSDFQLFSTNKVFDNFVLHTAAERSQWSGTSA